MEQGIEAKTKLGGKRRAPASFGRWAKAEPQRDAQRDTNGIAAVEPTPERHQHGKIVQTISIATDQEEARPGVRMHRTQPPVERYAKRGIITARQAMAADDLRSDWEFGIIGIKSGVRIVSGGGPISLSDAQLDAATAYRVAVQAIGQRVSAILLPIVIGDAAGGEITAEQLASNEACPYNRKQVMGILSVGLDMLADHYERCDNPQRGARYG